MKCEMQAPRIHQNIQNKENVIRWLTDKKSQHYTYFHCNDERQPSRA